MMTTMMMMMMITDIFESYPHEFGYYSSKAILFYIADGQMDIATISLSTTCKLSFKIGKDGRTITARIGTSLMSSAPKTVSNTQLSLGIKGASGYGFLIDAVTASGTNQG
ncbi:hypothetical protein EVAR_40450_1 [Eumeta japonica]|uniref:Uncharacterized protein n=1 Tax=Eumeta variegata TaxID=151549 RepID=A0A4C1X262_EUMVA|nr:hypothetical protein EVAR_40450_1 [Eumeta japonica]